MSKSYDTEGPRLRPGGASDFVRDLRAGFLVCRAHGHAWSPSTVAVTDSPTGAMEYHVELRCPRCKAERVQVLDRTGDVKRSSYRYPEGYLSPGGGVDRREVRMEQVRRMRGEA